MCCVCVSECAQVTCCSRRLRLSGISALVGRWPPFSATNLVSQPVTSARISSMPPPAAAVVISSGPYYRMVMRGALRSQPRRRRASRSSGTGRGGRRRHPACVRQQRPRVFKVPTCRPGEQGIRRGILAHTHTGMNATVRYGTYSGS